ncbi:MAG: hypothetical protein Q4G19_03955 [Clostridia bacterium]|nr:hypothetical protein [Clostridia bacterium]
MKFVLCPRCELNYMQADDKYCKVCMREVKGESPREEVELCSVCNEAPALPGKDVCLFCLREMNGETMQTKDDNDSGETIDTDSIGNMDSVSSMDEIIPEMDESDIDFGEDDTDEDEEKEMSLEAVRDDEIRDDEAADEEPEEF